MRVSFLVSADAYNRLLAAALERGWASDPGYADRTAQRFFRTGGPTDSAHAPHRDLDYQGLAALAAMTGDFAAASLEDVAAAISRFFGECPRRLEVDGAEYAVDFTLGGLRPV